MKEELSLLWTETFPEEELEKTNEELQGFQKTLVENIICATPEEFFEAYEKAKNENKITESCDDPMKRCIGFVVEKSQEKTIWYGLSITKVRSILDKDLREKMREFEAREKFFSTQL